MGDCIGIACLSEENLGFFTRHLISRAEKLTRYCTCAIFLSPIYQTQRTFSGTICISMTLITSAISPYLFKCLPDSIKQISLVKRCIVLFVSNFIFVALMGVVDVVLEKNPSGELVFVIIFVLRSLQGFAIGLIYTIVQVNAF